MTYVLVFLAKSLAIEVGYFDSELDCQEVAAQLNKYTTQSEYNCEQL
jgi:hypothetical protein